MPVQKLGPDALSRDALIVGAVQGSGARPTCSCRGVIAACPAWSSPARRRTKRSAAARGTPGAEATLVGPACVAGGGRGDVVGGAVRDHQVTPRRYLVFEPVRDGPGIFAVLGEVQYRDQQDRSRPLLARPTAS